MRTRVSSPGPRRPRIIDLLPSMGPIGRLLLEHAADTDPVVPEILVGWVLGHTRHTVLQAGGLELLPAEREQRPQHSDGGLFFLGRFSVPLCLFTPLGASTSCSTRSCTSSCSCPWRWQRGACLHAAQAPQPRSPPHAEEHRLGLVARVVSKHHCICLQAIEALTESCKPGLPGHVVRNRDLAAASARLAC